MRLTSCHCATQLSSACLEHVQSLSSLCMTNFCIGCPSSPRRRRLARHAKRTTNYSRRLTLMEKKRLREDCGKPPTDLVGLLKHEPSQTSSSCKTKKLQTGTKRSRDPKSVGGSRSMMRRAKFARSPFARKKIAASRRPARKRCKWRGRRGRRERS